MAGLWDAWMDGWNDGWVTTELATRLNCGHVIYVPNAWNYNNHVGEKRGFSRDRVH